MNSYRQILYHIVFCTHDRHRTLPPEHHPELYKYVQGVVKNRNCTLYQINGTENHVHLLSDLHPIICLADFIKEIKNSHQLLDEINRELSILSLLVSRICSTDLRIQG